MGRRQRQLDSPLHDEVLPNQSYIKHNHSARDEHTAWSPPSLLNSIVLLGGIGEAAFTAEIVPGTVPGPGTYQKTIILSFPSGGGAFALKHDGGAACGISDKDTIVMTGGRGHNYVTR